MRKLLIDYTLMALTILVLVYPKSAVATETDSYTYACIKIEDSADKINFKLNQILSEVVAKANVDIKKFPKTTWQFYLSYYYYKTMFVDNLGYDAFSVFETCIDTNKCEGWPYFERIYVKPSETVYAKANYSLISKNHIASNVEACGVRFGTDKLTHFLKDGFRMYYAKKNSGYSDLTLARASQASEETFFGKNSTGVFSRADMQANTNGLRFFQDLYEKHIVKKDGQIYLTPMNICNYINKNFDERIMKNEYSQRSKKVEALMKAIEESKNSCSESNRDAILARTSQPLSVTDAEKMSVGFSNIRSLFNSDFNNAKNIFLEKLFKTQRDYDNYPVY